MTGTVEMAGHNISGPVALYQEGNKSYTVIDIPGIGKVEEGFDGETAWEMNALQGAASKTARRRRHRAFLEDSMLSSCATTIPRQTLGSEDVEGKSTWKVEMTPKEGKPEVFYFDKNTMLLVRTTATIATALGEIPWTRR